MDTYKHGDPWYVCRRCHLKIRLSEVKKDRTGLGVCEGCADPLHPQENPTPIRRERLAVKNPSPRASMYFEDANHVLNTQYPFWYGGPEGPNSVSGNHSPTVERAYTSQSIVIGSSITSYDFSSAFSDQDNDSLVYVALGDIASGLVLTGGVLSGIPAKLGRHSVSVYANDGRQSSATTSEHDVLVIPSVTSDPLEYPNSGFELEASIKSITLIPGSGEFVYETQIVQELYNPGYLGPYQNLHTDKNKANILVALDNLAASCPNLEHVALVVSWFGNDLRLGECELKPGIERVNRVLASSTNDWGVENYTRGDAHLISSDENGFPNYGGTPNDEGVKQAIQEIKARGWAVTLYPFILMDIPPESDLIDPYLRDRQPDFPWRGRMTCHPAPGYSNTPDGTTEAQTQVETFFNRTHGLRRQILHYAQLAVDAGGVESILIGSEMLGLTRVRSAQGTYPAAGLFKTLADDVRAIVGAGTKITYAANWDEYGSYVPPGTNDLDFPLDELWGHSNIDFVGIDWYPSMSDWRDGDSHIDAQSYPWIYDSGYLQSNIQGGENYDWYYASQDDRDNQTRTPITDGGYSKPWVYRAKDLTSWWNNQHYSRSNGVESPTPTSWVPQSKPIHLTEIGVPAVDKGTNQPNVFVDPKSSESFFPHYSTEKRDDFIQRQGLVSLHRYWNSPVNNPSMVNADRMSVWTWDARPFPVWPFRADIWSDGDNHQFGHWLTGRLGTVGIEAFQPVTGFSAPTSDGDVGSQEVSNGSAVSAFDFSLHFQDSDGHGLRYYLIESETNGLIINAVTGVLSGVPSNGVGSYNIVVQGVDPIGLSAYCQYTINVVT